MIFNIKIEMFKWSFHSLNSDFIQILLFIDTFRLKITIVERWKRGNDTGEVGVRHPRCHNVINSFYFNGCGPLIWKYRGD